MLLTHFYPPCDAVDVVALAAQEFSGEILRAEDGRASPCEGEISEIKMEVSHDVASVVPTEGSSFRYGDLYEPGVVRRLRISQENFEKIQTGMSLAQVTAILGEPTESSSVDVAVFSGTVSKWKAEGVTITIQFVVNGKVVAKQLSKGDK